MATTSLSSGSNIDSKINSLLSTYQWGITNGNAVTITYSFPEAAGSTWVSDYGKGEPFSPNSFTPLTETQRNDFREALATWSDVANIKFVETNDTLTQGDIRVAYSSLVIGNEAAYAYYAPTYTLAEYTARFTNGASSYAANGDIWINPVLQDFSQKSQDNFSTLVHEIGHSLGLKHPFSGEPANPTVLTGSEDSNKYSVMSYTSYDIGYKSDGSASIGYTPMLYDVAAMQFLYGANTSTRQGDDTYTFSNSEPELKTIWDGGGNDTFDLSNQTLAMTVDLTAGNFSSIGIKYLLDGQTVSSSPVASKDNIAIAYNVEIENAIGGTGNDTITGNSLNNQLTGGRGNDIISGGAGTDTSLYSSVKQNFLIQKTNSQITVTDQGGTEGVDSLSSIERIQFSDMGIAFDTGLTESAGMTARLLVAAFGRDALSNEASVGIGINLFDNGNSFEQVSLFAINSLANPPTNGEFVSAVWMNIFGGTIDSNNFNIYTQILDNKEMTQETLLVAASQDSVTNAIIQATGVNETGLNYSI
jgi:serralysin